LALANVPPRFCDSPARFDEILEMLKVDPDLVPSRCSTSDDKLGAVWIGAAASQEALEHILNTYVPCAIPQSWYASRAGRRGRRSGKAGPTPSLIALVPFEPGA
jgi:hypothetical protein